MAIAMPHFLSVENPVTLYEWEADLVERELTALRAVDFESHPCRYAAATADSSNCGGPEVIDIGEIEQTSLTKLKSRGTHARREGKPGFSYHLSGGDEEE